GTIWGTATIGTCSSSDTAVIDIFPALSAPSGNNIDICGPGEVKVGALSNAQTILWYDAMAGGNVLGFGDSLALNLTNTTSVYPEGISAVPQSVGPPLNNLGNGGTYNFGDGRGIQFDAYEDIIIQSIAVFPSQTSPSVPLTVDIELRDNLNNTLAVRPVVLNNPANKVEIPLWIPVSAGTTYSLVINHLQGGNLYLNFNNTGWPYEIPGVVKLIRSVPTSINYYFLYDWKVITNDKFCVSNRSQIDVNVLPAPVVDLGKDTVLCGGNPLSLDATNPGATYLWNTGQTSASISVTTTDTFYVDVAIGNCSTSDTVLVSAFSNPVVSGVADTTICGPQTIAMNVNSSGMQTLWYNASNPTTVASFGESYSVAFPDTTTFLIQTLNGVSRNLGPEENTIGTGGTYSFGDGRGLRFDAYQDFLLKSVFVYPKTTNAGNPVMSFDIELRNAAGTVLNSRHITYQNPAQVKTEVELWFSVKAGTGQKLVINNLVGGNLFLNFNNSQFPYEFPGFAKITSSVESNNNNSSNYFFLYDWQILTDGFTCKSNIVSKTINVNLPLSLPDSMYQCEAFVFDPQVFANSYSWSTGETTGPIFIDETGTYILTVSDGGSCTITDTLKVELAAPAGLPDDG
ncbi:MAG: hypothetical protein KDD99_29675, partial [Bacteroidetes bacterium]|nr:hypothetical protein [Bacteroidota bacterium]